MTTLRSAEQLRALYVSRRARGVSLADGPGFLYAFVEYGHHWKIGMTDNYDWRKAEWDQSLAHILLELKCFQRPRIWCTQCVTLKNSYSLENRDAFGEGRFGQCLCTLHFCKALKSPTWSKYRDMNTEDLMGRFRLLVQDLTQSRSLLLLYI
ncbi:hypothetical protein C8R41DRAFT_865346 [Lentinula lateritia]|uniref:Uncharacterized protein n=1 Tax=Lentinula lateritia TaxID=40482 RepID=A0ABQ8VQ45_9AGAR|nr:hypothetical protein C8R41DRAFT_865346 [Lentinula lateritia]